MEDGGEEKRMSIMTRSLIEGGAIYRENNKKRLGFTIINY
jgi:hypothetical protein